MRPRHVATGRVLALWGGVVVAWGAALVVVYLQWFDYVAPTLVVTSVLALVGGIVGTVRIRASLREPLITVEQLRRR